MVVSQFNVKSIGTLEPKNDAPVRPHGHRPETPQVAFERMKMISGETKLLRGHGVIGNSENFLNCIYKVRPYSSAVLLLVKPLKAAMLKAPDH